MNRKQYRKIAKIHGVSIKEVRAEMQAAIDEAFINPNFHAKCIYSKGDKPTVDDVVEHLARRARVIVK